MNKLILAVLFGFILVFAGIPDFTADAQVQEFYSAAYNDTASATSAPFAFHSPIEIDFSQADSIDLEFHFQGPFYGNITLAPQSDLVPSAARADSAIVIGFDSTQFALGDTVIHIPHFKLKEFVRAAGFDDLEGEWNLWVHPLPGVTWAEEFKVYGVLQRKTWTIW